MDSVSGCVAELIGAPSTPVSAKNTGKGASSGDKTDNFDDVLSRQRDTSAASGPSRNRTQEGQGGKELPEGGKKLPEDQSGSASVAKNDATGESRPTDEGQVAGVSDTSDAGTDNTLENAVESTADSAVASTTASTVATTAEQAAALIVGRPASAQDSALTDAQRGVLAQDSDGPQSSVAVLASSDVGQDAAADPEFLANLRFGGNAASINNPATEATQPLTPAAETVKSATVIPLSSSSEAPADVVPDELQDIDVTKMSGVGLTGSELEDGPPTGKGASQVSPLLSQMNGSAERSTDVESLASESHDKLGALRQDLALSQRQGSEATGSLEMALSKAATDIDGAADNLASRLSAASPSSSAAGAPSLSVVEAAASSANTAKLATLPPMPTAMHGVLGDNGAWGDALAARVSVMLKNELQEASVKLNPPELGRLDIRIVTEGDQAKVQFAVHNSEARDVIEQSLPRLRELLEQSGLQLARGEVADQSGGQFDQGSDTAPGSGSSRDELAVERERTAVSRTVDVAMGQVDYYV